MRNPKNALEILSEFMGKAEKALRSRVSDDGDPVNQQILNGFLEDADRFLAGWCDVPPDVFVYSIEKGDVSHLGLDLSAPAVQMRRHAEIKGLTFSYGVSDRPGQQARLSIPQELRYVLYHIREIDEHKQFAFMAYEELEHCIRWLDHLISSIRPRLKEIHAAITPIYSLRSPKSFSDIKLRPLEDDEYIRVYSPGQAKGQKVSCSEFGMANKKTKEHTELWTLFVNCVRISGRLPQKPKGSRRERNRLRSIKRRLKEKLCVAFGTDEDPFFLSTDGTGYQLKCQILPEQHSHRERRESDMNMESGLEAIDSKRQFENWQHDSSQDYDNDE